MPDPASGMEMDKEFADLVGRLADAMICPICDEADDGSEFDTALAAMWRWHLDAVREAYQDGYEAGYEAGARDEFITRRDHPTAEPEA